MKMKHILLAMSLLIATLHHSSAQITESPKVEEQSVNDVKIKKVELTDKYTIVYLQFTQARSAGSSPFRNMPDLQMPNSGGPTIWLDPATRLYKPGDINTKFKLIRAENIPTKEKRMRVSDGEVVDFVAYFERLTKGIEVFDFYEGRAVSKSERTWNFYGIHINNPKNNVKPDEKPVAKKQEAPVIISDPEPEKKAAAENKFGQLSMKVVDAQTKESISSNITYSENEDSLSIASTAGQFRVAIDLAKTYTFNIHANGYFSESVELIPADSVNNNSFSKEIFLKPLKLGETIGLPNIYFETSKFDLLKESHGELNKLVKFMTSNPNMSIRIEGHTDNVGDFDQNLELSRKRAESVKNYLVAQGIDEKRIEAKGFGSTRPIAKNNSAEEHSKNRRVEFVVIAL